MPRAKKKQPKLSQAELFPHSREFPYRLELDTVIEGLGTIAWFQCEFHLTKHINRYNIVSGRIDVMDGAEPLSSDPFATKPKSKRTTTKKPSATKASKVTKTKKPVKPAAKTTTAKRTRKTAKKEVFSTIDNFFDS